MDIGTLTTLLLGYKTAERLYELERIEGERASVDRLDDVLFHKIPYISDYIEKGMAYTIWAHRLHVSFTTCYLQCVAICHLQYATVCAGTFLFSGALRPPAPYTETPSCISHKKRCGL